MTALGVVIFVLCALGALGVVAWLLVAEIRDERHRERESARTFAELERRRVSELVPASWWLNPHTDHAHVELTVCACGAISSGSRCEPCDARRRPAPPAPPRTIP